jgi:ribosomal protein S2
MLREFPAFNFLQGFFSNNLNPTKLRPDLVIIFHSSEHYSFLKELYLIGIPIIATIEKFITISYVEYPIFLNAFCYYAYFFILKLYGKLILLCENN